ncbi:MAG: sigma-70 family RNA polymerase sigma factor [Fuerstiella sp.]
MSLLTSAQDSLYRYVLTLVAGQHHRAKDLLQETNLVVWRKASEFRWGTDFDAWARRIANFCVLSDQRDKQRSPIAFGEELIHTLAAEHDKHAQEVESRRSLLEDCLVKLPRAQRAIIRLRYVDGLSVAEIAKNQGKSPNTTSAFLYRIRLALLHCVGRKAV